MKYLSNKKTKSVGQNDIHLNISSNGWTDTNASQFIVKRKGAEVGSANFITEKCIFSQKIKPSLDKMSHVWYENLYLKMN